MLILGFQKLTLLDFPNRVAATVFTGGCNFRCPFCHNSPLVTKIEPQKSYDQNEVLSYLKSRKGVLDGICITGGEPLIQRDIEDFMKSVKDMGFLVKLDTNGSFPNKLKEVVDKKLVDYVAMDIKNSKELYGETVGVKDFDLSPIEQSVDFLLSGQVEFEFRTTITKNFHTVQSVESLAKWIKGTKKYFLQNFEDSGDLISTGIKAVEKETLFEMKKVAENVLGTCIIRGV